MYAIIKPFDLPKFDRELVPAWMMDGGAPPSPQMSQAGGDKIKLRNWN